MLEMTNSMIGPFLCFRSYNVFTSSSQPDFNRYLLLIYNVKTAIKQLHHQQMKCIGAQVNNSCPLVNHTGLFFGCANIKIYLKSIRFARIFYEMDLLMFLMHFYV